MNERESELVLADDAPREPDELGELTDDAITGSYRIWQRKRGHRYSLDDVLTAWVAARALPAAHQCLELGTGIGSVLLMLAYSLPQASFVAIEAQRNSYALLQRNVQRNGLLSRVRAHRGDFRAQVREDMQGAPFDLVTGTPPYAPLGTATASTDAQRAYARQELRGGVEAYVEAASQVLSAQGRAVICGDARTPARVEGAAEEHGLAIVARLDAVPRERHKGPLFSVWTLARSGQVTRAPSHATWCARDARGTRTQAYREVRAFFGVPGAENESPSP